MSTEYLMLPVRFALWEVLVTVVIMCICVSIWARQWNRLERYQWTVRQLRDMIDRDAMKLEIARKAITRLTDESEKWEGSERAKSISGGKPSTEDPDSD